MKRQIIFGSFVALSGLINAQATWNGAGTTGNANRSGNIGINNTSPSYALDVTSTIYDNGIRAKNGTTTSNIGLHLDNTTAAGNRWGIMSMGTGDPWGGAGNFAIYNYGSPGGSLPSFYISGGLGANPTNGNIGIGTTSPNRKLTVNGDVSFVNTGGPNAFEILGNGQIPVRRGISIDADPNGHFDFFIHNWQTGSGTPEFRFKDAAANKDLMKIDGGGKITIKNYYSNGTDDAFVIIDAVSNITNFKVKRNGSTYAREVTVQMTNFPDYVFKTNYKLMPLSEVETYVTKNSHLPNVPTAKEVETNGANLGEVQKATIEKTEELFLYLFELNKRVKNLEKENKELKEKIGKGK